MQPWLVTAMVALPICENTRRGAGNPVLDVMLARDAKAAGKEVAGLETAVSQLQAMASLPRDFHVQGLVDTLKLGPRRDDLFETMIVLYLAGETGMVWPLFKAIQPEGDDNGGLAAFERAMITSRNHTMAESAAALIEAGGAFIAVGALHLPGSEGLIELLRQRGYRIDPVQ
jgi:uncharacterized protein YbaP (TraB family)